MWLFVLCSVCGIGRALTANAEESGRVWEAISQTLVLQGLEQRWGIRFQAVNSNPRVLLLTEPLHSHPYSQENQSASGNEVTLFEEGHLVLMKKINKWVIVSCLEKGHFGDLVSRSYEYLLNSLSSLIAS